MKTSEYDEIALTYGRNYMALALYKNGLNFYKRKLETESDVTKRMFIESRVKSFQTAIEIVQGPMELIESTINMQFDRLEKDFTDELNAIGLY